MILHTLHFKILMAAQLAVRSQACNIGYKIEDSPYLDVQVLINLDSLSKDVYPLCEIRKFPHASNALDHRALLLRCNILHILSSSLFGRHHVGEFRAGGKAKATASQGDQR